MPLPWLSVGTEAGRGRWPTEVNLLTPGVTQAQRGGRPGIRVLRIAPGTPTSGMPSMTWVLSGVVCSASVGEADRPRVGRRYGPTLSSLSSPHRPTCRCCSASSSTAQGWPNRTLPSTSPSMNSCFWMPAPPHLLTPQSCFSM